MKTPESDEVAGHMYRLAQSIRLLRYCREQGFHPKTTDELTSWLADHDISAIEDESGQTVPESEDLDAAQ